MSDIRRALCWFLVVALFTTIALMVAGEPGEPGEPADTSPLITTPSTTQPVIAHIEETP